MKDRAPRGFSVFDLDRLHDDLSKLWAAVDRLNGCRAAGLVPRTDEDARIIATAADSYRNLIMELMSFDFEGHRDPHLSGSFAVDHSIFPSLMKAFLQVTLSQGYSPLDAAGTDAAERYVMTQAICLSRMMAAKVVPPPHREFPDFRLPAEPRRAPVAADTRRQALDRDRNRCVECGTTEDLCLDHIHPWSKGGPDDLENFQILCRPCNSSKRDRVEPTANAE